MSDAQHLLESALAIAGRAHEGQTDKSGLPYIGHVMRVVDAVASPLGKVAAALHDVVEDTDMTIEDLTAAGFPESVTEAVDALTRRPTEPYMEFVRRAGTNLLAREVKMADLLDNADPSRLAGLPDDEGARLAAKYDEAIRYLESTARTPGGEPAQ